MSILIPNLPETLLLMPDAPIPKDYVMNLVQRYKDLHHAYLQSHPGIGYNTVYVSFDLPLLIEELKKMYDNGNGADGCRIYFGAHDSDAPMPGGYNYRNKMTLIFVGTKSQENGCPVEMLDNQHLAYDFGTLCPPECDSCCADNTSIATEVYKMDSPCNH